MKTTLGKESLVEKQHCQTLVFCSRNSLLRCSSVALPYQAFLQCWGRFSSLKTNRKQCLLQICEIPVFRVTSLHTSKLHHVLFMLSIHGRFSFDKIHKIFIFHPRNFTNLFSEPRTHQFSRVWTPWILNFEM